MAQTEQFRPVCANAIREPWQFDTEIAIKLSAATGLPAEHRRMVGGEKERARVRSAQGSVSMMRHRHGAPGIILLDVMASANEVKPKAARLEVALYLSRS